ncbi:hypothetical protein AQUCO_02400123v1 [Aquilegia coerulea]|uniref:Uncharacterized protein n=2 Tax=Aquilegia coerulea TaxID=218851 RepID=A0A2G5DBL0_AQUCA|nr:hypothetical protein AQUCO_02400123v1 [Aquilegia coerulea]
MSNIFRVRRNENVGSGGKIVRGRRVPDVRSPYTRPPSISSSAAPDDENPNRLVGLISPATRVISGAAKIISSVFFPDSPTASSSSEEDSDDEEDDISSEDDGRLHQNVATSEVNKYLENNIPLTIQGNENKLAIEQLLMQETFSRDEYNRFVKIIESRVVEDSANKDGNGNVFADGANGNGVNSSSSRGPVLFMPDITNAAVMEAKKWVEEKKLETNSHLDKTHGTFTSNTCMPSNVTEGESGSPVHMARSYMKSRTPMASPGLGHFGFQTPSPSRMHPLKEDTPYESGVHALSSSKDLKRSYLAVDSCNSVDGPRRVRFKSGEDAAQPLSENNYSQKHGTTSLAAEKRNDLGGAQITVEGGGSAHNAEDLVPGLHNGPDQSAVIVNSDLRGTRSDDINHALQSNLPEANGTDEFSLQPEAMQVTKSSLPDHSSDLKTTDSVDGLRSQEDHATEIETNGLNDNVVANGFSLRENAESNVAHNLTSDVKLEGSCELLSETMVEVPTNEEIDSTASGSLNNSRRSKDLLQTESESVSTPGKRRMSARVEKQVVKKAGTYNKRGRGRGK